ISPYAHFVPTRGMVWESGEPDSSGRGFSWYSSNPPDPEYSSIRGVSLPYWFLLLLSVPLPIRHLLGFVRRRMRRRWGRGLCPKCGFDVRANPERCSECGFPLGERVIRELLGKDADKSAISPPPRSGNKTGDASKEGSVERSVERGRS